MQFIFGVIFALSYSWVNADSNVQPKQLPVFKLTDICDVDKTKLLLSPYMDSKPEKIRPKLKASDFICRSEAIKSSLDGYLEPEKLNKFIDMMAPRFKGLDLGDEVNEIDTKLFVGFLIALDSVDPMQAITREHSVSRTSVPFHELMETDLKSLDLAVLKNAIAKYLSIYVQQPIEEIKEWIDMDINQAENFKCIQKNIIKTESKEKSYKNNEL